MFVEKESEKKSILTNPGTVCVMHSFILRTGYKGAVIDCAPTYCIRYTELPCDNLDHHHFKGYTQFLGVQYQNSLPDSHSCNAIGLHMC